MAKYIDGNDLCQMLTDQEIKYHMDATGEVALERKYGDVLGDVFEEDKEETNREMVWKTCIHCGTEFESIKGKGKIYCTDRCAVRYRNERSKKNG